MLGHLLVIHGENGTGKTHCAKRVHKWVGCTGHGKQFIRYENEVSHIKSAYWNWPALLDALKSGEWHLVEDLIEVDVLIIDELGGGHDPSFVGVDKLCQILSARENKWTLITTNITPDNWETKFDRRVASRMVRNSVIVDLSGVPDYATRP